MNILRVDLWTWHGRIDRAEYATLGVLLFAIKYNVDRLVAGAAFHRSWYIFNYWIPGVNVHRGGVPRNDWPFFLTLLLVSLPFIWTGVVLTLRRLRAAELPLWLVVFFFLPILNVFFFLLLSVLPSREEAEKPEAKAEGRLEQFLSRVIPEHPIGSAAMALVLTTLLAIPLIGGSVYGVGSYGWSLFVGIPFVLGLNAVLLHSYRSPRDFGACVLVSFLSVVLAGVTLFILAVEGFICLMMAAPLAVPLALMGGVVGYVIQRRRWQRNEVSHALSAVLLSIPMSLAVETGRALEPPLIEIRTAVEIEAAPAEVWSHVVAFSELPPPEDWVFRTGVAYPIRAQIEGRGPGAVRHCVFSTGAFDEPIEVWDAPRLLKFSVTSQPASMQELSLYSDIRPPHIEGYLQSRRGQFLLQEIARGRTRLEGTTWYQNRMWPSFYWRLWSDFLIHRIHQRVLNHVKNLAERS